MLRIHLNAEDLAGVRIGTSWGPLTETLFSLELLEDPRPGPLTDAWRRRVAKRLGASEQRLLTMVQPFAHVDLHTLTGESSSLDEALDALLGVRHDHLRTEIEQVLPGLATIPDWSRAWLRDLTGGDPKARKHLAMALRAYSARAIDPYWDGIRSHLEVERAVRGRIMSEGGVKALLAGLHPRISWRPPVLEVDDAPARPLDPARPYRPPHAGRRDVHPDGRSLVLVPSVFCRRPMLFQYLGDETAPEVLFYPALSDLGQAMTIWRLETSCRPALEALLGGTRAMALEAIADTCTTNELARRTGVSPSTASHHASVLRKAGLVSTQRNGSAVLHCLTIRGALLLDGKPLRPPAALTGRAPRGARA